MSLKPKIEFFTVRLNPKNEEVKTFRDFVIDELKGKESDDNETIYKKLFKHFMKGLEDNQIAKSEKLRKEIKLVKSSKNRFLNSKPSFQSEKYYISGVINGGYFGKEGILTSKETDHSINRDMSVLYYYYVFMYLPLDYKEGFIIVHSNSKEENVTNIYKHFCERLFVGQNYKVSKASYFTPKVFQEEFLNHSYLSHLTFKNTIIDDYDSRKGVSDKVNKYKVNLVITPDTEDKVSFFNTESLREFFGSIYFGRKDRQIELGDFEGSSVTLQNSKDNSEKTFNWNIEKQDFIPVVYLNGRIERFNADGTPHFDELDSYCQDLFERVIHKEVRPDLYVSKIK